MMAVDLRVLREQLIQAAVLLLFIALISWVFYKRVLPIMYPGL